MRILVNADRTSDPVLARADDFTDLAVEVTGDHGHREAVSDSLARSGAGTLEGDHVLVDLAWLSAAVLRDSPQRAERYAAMLRYARTRGWVSDDAASVRAHLTWTDE
jgi:hypothetical protein